MPISNPAAGHQIQTGTYTGNGAAARQITTGFKCQWVVIACHDDTTLAEVLLLPTATIVKRTGAGAMLVNNAISFLHATNGFVVDLNYDNENLKDYRYVAVSE